MAMNAKEDNTEDNTERISCGYCLRVLSEMEDPRQLPCTHVFCMQCLSSDYQTKGCPFCGASCKGEILENLKRYDGREEEIRATEANLQPGVPCDYKCDGQMASTFCTQCKKAMCVYHEKKHDDLFDLDHDKISIQSYLSSKHKFTRSVCPEHPRLELVMGCEVCLQTFCNECDCTVECKPLSIPELKVAERDQKVIGCDTILCGKGFGTSIPAFSFAATSASSTNSRMSGGQLGPFAPTLSTGLFGATSASSENSSRQSRTSIQSLAAQALGAPAASSMISSGMSLFGKSSCPEAVKFTPVDGTDSVARNGVSTIVKTKHYCISGMKEYENQSTEEIRYQSYKDIYNYQPTPFVIRGRSWFDEDEDNKKKEGSQQQYLISSLQSASSSPQYDSAGKLKHKLVPISTLIKDARKRLDAFVAGAFAKETEICKKEKVIAKIIENSECNTATIETDIDCYVNQLCDQVRKKGEIVKRQAKLANQSVASTSNRMLSNLATDRESLEMSIIEISNILSTCESPESITYYRDKLSAMHRLLKEPDQPPSLELKTVRMNDLTMPFRDLFKLECYSPNHLDYHLSMDVSSPVIAVCSLSDRRIAVAYENKVEIRNLQLEELRHMVCSEFQVIGLSVIDNKRILVLVHTPERTYDVMTTDTCLKQIQKLFSTNVEFSPLSNICPDIFTSSRRIIITGPWTKKLFIYDIKGLQLNCLELSISPHTLAILGKYTIAVNNGFDTHIIIVNDFGLTVEKDLLEYRSASNQSLFSPIPLPWLTPQQSNLNFASARTGDSTTKRSGFSFKSALDELATQTEKVRFNARQNHFSKTRDEHHFYYLAKHNIITNGVAVKVISAAGIVGTLTSDKLKGIKVITGIAVTGDKLLLACGSQGLKLFSIR